MRLAALIALAALAACGGRAHLEPSFGASTRDQLASQVAAPAAGARRSAAQPGLDAQEAAIIARAYRKSLTPKEPTREAEPLLLVAPPQMGYQQPALAPSVPKE